MNELLLLVLFGLAIACGLATVIKRNRAVAECVFLRTHIEALEKARLLAVSEWSTWKDVLVSNMTEADWRETMDGLRVPAALAAEETTTIYATTISDEDGNSLGDDAALAAEPKLIDLGGGLSSYENLGRNPPEERAALAAEEPAHGGSPMTLREVMEQEEKP